MIRVLLVDDHALVRSGLAALLTGAPDVEVVAEAADGRAGVDAAVIAEPDVVLMDLSMPTVAKDGLDGIGATRELLARRPGTRIVVLTSFTDEAKVRDALAAGAIGYVLKDCRPAELLDAVRSAAAGHTPLDPRVAGALLPSARRPGTQLSDRETQVLRLAAQGLANKQIGSRLGIAERTVKVHLGSVFRQLGVADRTSAALWARDHLPD